jgi:hypothetical protein
MPKATKATVTRNASTGKFIVRKGDGTVSSHAAGKKAAKTVSASIQKNRDALKRLANR